MSKLCKVVIGYRKQAHPTADVDAQLELFDIDEEISYAEIPIRCDQPATENRTEALTHSPAGFGHSKDLDLWYCPNCAKRFDADQQRLQKRSRI